MKKTLLSALKHGSGILLTLFSLLCACQVWAGELTRDKTYYVHFKDDSPLTNQQLISSEASSKNHYLSYFVIPGSSSNYEFTIYCSDCDDTPYYRNANQTFSGESTTVTTIDATSGNRMKITPLASSGYVGVTADMYCSYGSDSRLTINQYVVRYFSAGEYIYFVNGTNYDYNGGYIGDRWIFSDSYAGIKLTMSDETTQYAWFEYDETASGGKSAGTVGAVYKARIGTAGYCKKFVITRSNTYDPSQDPTTITASWKHITSDLTYDATHVTYNTVTNTTAGTGWTGNYTAYCSAPTPATGASSSVTSSSATLAATVTSGICTTTYVGVNVYSDSSCETLVDSDETAYVDDETTYTFDISLLSPVTTYYYKAYAKSAAGTTVAASSNNFTTLCRDEIEVDGPADGSMTICAGAGDALSVTASGASDYTYQWYYNSTASTEGATSIDGANSASYSPTISGTKYYYCVVGADTYCDKTSSFSGAITYDSSKTSPVITASATSVTNYIPVTLTVTGADVNTWNVSGGNTSDRYLYKESGKGAMFKGTVGSGSDVAYTVTGTASNGCSSAVSITVSSNTHHCR